MTNQMNHALTATALAICSLAWSAPGMAHDGGDADPPCSEQTLNGSYVLAASGFQIVGGVAQPKALIEQIDFNGRGYAVVPNAKNSVNGVLGGGSDNPAGTYTLNTDCTGVITFASGPAHTVYMDPDGSKGWTLLSDFPSHPSPLNQVFPGTLTRVSSPRDRH